MVTTIKSKLMLLLLLSVKQSFPKASPHAEKIVPALHTLPTTFMSKHHHHETKYEQRGRPVPAPQWQCVGAVVSRRIPPKSH